MSEHNENYSAAFKNVFDWCTRINGKVFQKTDAVVSDFSWCWSGASVLKLLKMLFQDMEH
jgi:NAD(P)H-dependent FMN reductase